MSDPAFPDEVAETIVTINEQYADNLEQEILDEAGEGADDGPVCTYEEGYITQEVFACRTCASAPQPEGSLRLPVALCAPCAQACHESIGHDVVSLSTKRHIRCDCGNDRLPRDTACQFPHNPPKDVENADNDYEAEHNYFGKYCWCDQDDDGTQMIQCTLCQDWFHDKCVRDSGEFPSLDTFRAFVCRSCVADHPFLLDYAEWTAKPSLAGESEPKQEGPSTRSASACRRPSPSKGAASTRNLFFVADWRSKLCRCDSCLKLYSSEKVGYILSEEDNIRDEGDDEDDAADPGEPSESSAPIIAPLVQEADGSFRIAATVRGGARGEDVQNRVMDGVVTQLLAQLPASIQRNLQIFPEAMHRMRRTLVEELRPYAERGEVVSKEVIVRAFKRLREEDGDSGQAVHRSRLED